jgi:hypothetical protein
MRKFMVIALLAGLPATAAQAQTIGDVDCFGTVFGAQPVCQASYNIPAIPTDGRSPGETAATNGAQQTDFYSALNNPLPESFELRWNIGTLSAGASITYRTYGLQSTQFGAFLTLFNGVAETGFLDFQDGAEAVVTRTLVLNAGMIARANGAGQLLIDVGRNGSNDAVAFDYFTLSTTVVPEPSTYALLATGLAALVAVARRRRV